MKIFVIDDEPLVLRMLGRQLKMLGFTEVTAHEHALDALRILEHDPASADMILLDLQMPDMDGIEFVRNLARLKYAGGVILISGEDERVLQTSSTLASAHRLDVRGATNKPVSLAQLRTLLDAPSKARKSPPGTLGKPYTADELRRAIANHEMVNHYQPKVEFATGRVVGVETLVRWQHPTDGLVPPERFVGIAEADALVDALIRSVLRGALRLARAWQDDGWPIVVAVNVSMENLAVLDFPDFIERAVRDAGVTSRQLVLEVTETRLMTDVVMALDILTRLRLKHVGLSIDDFGTGHSSLTQLRSIPFDELKIDRSFVHGADRDPAALAIVEASLGMARQLRLKTVAEGVEDFADWQQMRAMGCDIAQGHFIARPMPAESLKAWSTAWMQQLDTLILQ